MWGSLPEAALLCFLFFQRSVDLALRVHNSGLHRKGLAGPDPTVTKVHGPLKAGWIGCLHDLVLDASVFHARNNKVLDLHTKDAESLDKHMQRRRIPDPERF
jgi:hypothetical protein